MREKLKKILSLECERNSCQYNLRTSEPKLKEMKDSYNKASRTWSLIVVILVQILPIPLYAVIGYVLYANIVNMIMEAIVFFGIPIKTLSDAGDLFSFAPMIKHPIILIVVPVIAIIVYLNFAISNLLFEVDYLRSGIKDYNEKVVPLQNEIDSCKQKLPVLEQQLNKLYSNVGIPSQYQEMTAMQIIVKTYRPGLSISECVRRCEDDIAEKRREIERRRRWNEAYEKMLERESEREERQLEREWEQSHRSLLESYVDYNKRQARNSGRLYGDWEHISTDDGEYLEQRYGEFNTGISGPRRKIVEKTDDGWVKDDYGSWHAPTSRYEN